MSDLEIIPNSTTKQLWYGGGLEGAGPLQTSPLKTEVITRILNQRPEVFKTMRAVNLMLCRTPADATGGE